MTDLSQPIDTVLRLIREERAFRADFSIAAESIIDKVYSYYTNANCTCKGSVIDWIGKNTEAVNALLVKHKDAVSAMNADVAKAAEITKNSTPSAPTLPTPAQYNPASMLSNPKAKFGAVIDIERDPEEYKKLIHTALTEGWVYRGCNVVPDIVDGKAVWSVFFF